MTCKSLISSLSLSNAYKQTTSQKQLYICTITNAFLKENNTCAIDSVTASVGLSLTNGRNSMPKHARRNTAPASAASMRSRDIDSANAAATTAIVAGSAQQPHTAVRAT